MINSQHLNQITGGDRALHQQLLQQFVETTETDVAKLHTAITQREFSKIKHFSHRIKGSAQLLCITPLVEIANVLENSSDSLLDTTLQERYQQLDQLFTQIKQQIQSIAP